MHNELPDILIPHKHYAAEVIQEVLDDKALSLGLSEEDYPCDTTKERWLDWFNMNRAQIEGVIRSVLYFLIDDKSVTKDSVSLLSLIREERENWLSYCVKVVYDLGYSLIFNST